MKRLFKKLEDLMIAITFAEAGEIETALEMIGKQPSNKEELIDDIATGFTDASEGTER